jgi:uncharacterized repeat protein (TIGR03803 family)
VTSPHHTKFVMRTPAIRQIMLAAFLLFCWAPSPAQSGPGWVETTIFQFDGSNGDNPSALVVGPGGLYGESGAGGAAGMGNLFRLSPPSNAGSPWSFSALYNFDGTDGVSPSGGLLPTIGGTFYGVTKGNIFEFSTNPSPQVTVLCTFSGDVGPVGPLIADANGNLYGVTSTGGAPLWGTVYELSPPAFSGGQWILTVLYTFTGGADGGEPMGGLLLDRNGRLYGTTATGGTSPGRGTVFELDPPLQPGGAWTETVLWSFTEQNGKSPGGYGPDGQLVMDGSGNLYGVTHFGGGYGSVYRLSRPAVGSSQWTETVLHKFLGGADGASPLAGLSWSATGTLFGTTAYDNGVPPNCGTVFPLVPTGQAWTYSVIYRFQGSVDGCNPLTKLLVTPSGAVFGASGALFELSPASN